MEFPHFIYQPKSSETFRFIPIMIKAKLKSNTPKCPARNQLSDITCARYEHMVGAVSKSEKPLRVLCNRLVAQDWNGPQDIKDTFGAIVDFVGDNRVIIASAYAYKRGMIKFVGTHSEYDKIDAETI